MGLVLAAVGVTGLAWAPVRAPQAGWGSAEVLTALAAGIVFLAAFLLWERREARCPMLPLAHFRHRGSPSPMRPPSSSSDPCWAPSS